MVNLVFGNSDGLMRTRSGLREFVSQRLLQNEPFSQATAARATGNISQELRPFLENVVSCVFIIHYWFFKKIIIYL